MSVEITEANFKETVLDSAEPVLVDFWAPWCGPCRMVGPVVDKLAESYAGKVKVGKINVDEQQALASKYRVLSIPSIFIFHKGEVVQKLVGARSYEELAQALDQIA